jgi:lipopolysaccharide transport system permease protein
VIELFRSLKKNRRLLVDLVKRDLRGRYVGSSMGFFWSVVFPIINLFVYMFVFSLVLKTRWPGQQSVQEVALIMLVGIMIWQAFAETISRTTNTLVENQNLIQKIVFPSEVLPLSLTISALVNMLIGIAIALIGVAWFAWIHPIPPDASLADVDPNAPVRHLGFGVTMLALPLLMVLQAVFTVGLGYFLATLNLFVRDIYHLMGVALAVWMFMTPIFYPARLVENAGYGWILQINPMYWLIGSYRHVLLYNEWPKPPIVAAIGVVAASVLALGSAFFLRQKGRFPDLL